MKLSFTMAMLWVIVMVLEQVWLEMFIWCWTWRTFGNGTCRLSFTQHRRKGLDFAFAMLSEVFEQCRADGTLSEHLKNTKMADFKHLFE